MKEHRQLWSANLQGRLGLGERQLGEGGAKPIPVFVFSLERGDRSLELSFPLKFLQGQKAIGTTGELFLQS